MFRFMCTLVAAFTIAPAVASAHGPGEVRGQPVGPERRVRPAIWQIQRRVDDKLVELESLSQQMLDLTSRRVTPRRVLLIKEASHRTMKVTNELRVLQRELGAALRELMADGGGWDDGEWPESEGAYVPVPFVPQALPRADFTFLLASIDRAAFPEPQKNAIRDVIRSGGFFDTAQAVTIMQRFRTRTRRSTSARCSARASSSAARCRAS